MSRIDLDAPRPGWRRRLLARIFGLAVNLRLALYRLKILRSRLLPAHVISVGNLAVGGTGKTPTVRLIAETLAREGWKTAVLSRGYRGRASAEVNVVSDGRKVLLGPSQAGDEPYFLAGELTGVPVLVGRDRWRLGQYAIENFGSEVLILDDGYQHLGLARDVNLLLLDAAQPWGNGFLLPAGRLREPKDQARRADAVILTRADGPRPASAAELENDLPGRPVFAARHTPRILSSLEGGETRPVDNLRGRRVIAFCGLARPMAFLETLQNLGAEVPVFIRWPDHFQPGDKEMALIQAKSREMGLNEAVTTAKDAVKLAGRALTGPAGTLKVWVLDVEMEILGPEGFFDLIRPAARSGE